MTGQVLSNRYLIGERIGIGGMAEVYQGQDTVLGRIVAIKVMLPQYAEDPTFTARFRQEAAAAANLQSPYIVNVYDWGNDNQTPFIVMEYIRGSDLKTAIKERGSINQRKVAEIGSQVCQALSVAHGLDIIHRDIKPQNIMVQPDGNVKVMDFGIARAKNSMMDKTEVVLGTAHYISPEQAQGKDLTQASDIYSLGIVLYEAVTGKLPFDGPDAVSVAMKQVNDLPLLPSQIMPSINSTLEAIIMKAMAKNPADRFATANDMRLALNEFLNGRPVSLDGMDAARTSVLMDGMTQNIGAGTGRIPTHMGAQPMAEPTGVMSPTEINSTVRQTVRPTNYRNNGGQMGGRTAQNGSGRKRGALVAVIAVLAVAIIGVLAFAVLGKGCSGQTIEVPDVTGKSLTEATTMIKNAGFELGTLDYKFDDSVDADTVIGQSPRSKTMQEKGSKISLTISRGAEQVSVPDLKNMTSNEARSTLQKYGLNYEIGESEASDDVAENRVARQTPSAGNKVDKGTKVTFYLSSGKEKTTVPDVRNALEGYATSVLQNAGFEVAIDYKESSDVPAGQVISQSPAGGNEAAKGSKVSLLVSTGAKYYIASAYVVGTAGGTVSPTYAEVAEGKSVTFYISTNAGYRIASVTDSSGNSYGSSTSVTINNVKSDVSITVTFEALPSSGGGESGGGGATDDPTT